jgi:hypothetical protein
LHQRRIGGGNDSDDQGDHTGASSAYVNGVQHAFPRVEDPNETVPPSGLLSRNVHHVDQLFAQNEVHDGL